MLASVPRPFVFGVPKPRSGTEDKLAEIVAWIGKSAEVDLRVETALSYEVLANCMREKTIDLAWLPPILFVHLEREGLAMPLVSHVRAGAASFHAALIVRAKSNVRTIASMRGARAAWVDPQSASGYVLPRIQLVALGIDPRTTFSDERFCGSHEGVVEALMSGAADVGATFATVNGAGVVSRGGWSDVPGGTEAVRVLTTFGSIPSDLIAVRTNLERRIAEAIGRGFVAASHDPVMGPLAKDLFGVEEWRLGSTESYAALRRAISDAAAHGLLDAAALRSGSMEV
jgi:phosphonate transport system substrate-binding protein